MTVIVGVEYNGHVFMGGDSLFVSHSERMHSGCKIFRRNQFLIGGAGDARIVTHLKYWTPPAHPSGMSDEEYVERIVLSEFANLNYEPEIMFAYHNKLYTCHNIVLQKPVAAIGSGAITALPILLSTEGLPIPRLRKALDYACAINTGCQAPYHFFCL